MQVSRQAIFNVFGLILIVAALIWWQTGSNQGAQNEETVERAPRITVSAEVQAGEGAELQEFPEISVTEGSSVLDVTTSLGEIEAENYWENPFVTSINGYKAKSDSNEFWKFSVNGEEAQVGAAEYIMQSGDHLRWEIDTY